MTTLLLVVLAVTAGYGITCAIWPLAACRRCRRRGRFDSPTGKAFRRCPRCKGSGTRIRLGRRLWNAAADLYDKT